MPLDELLPGVELDPERGDVEPLCEPGCVELPLGGVLKLPLELRLLPDTELPDAPELMPDCCPLVPGVPIPLAPAPLCCCNAIVRVSDSTICSRRATRASSEPEPEMLDDPAPSAPLLGVDPLNVPEPPTVDDWPSPPLDAEDVPAPG